MSAEEEKHDVVEGGEAAGVVAPVSEEESLGRLSDEAVAGMSEVDLLAAVEAGRLTGPQLQGALSARGVVAGTMKALQADLLRRVLASPSASSGVAGLSPTVESIVDVLVSHLQGPNGQLDSARVVAAAVLHMSPAGRPSMLRAILSDPKEDLPSEVVDSAVARALGEASHVGSSSVVGPTSAAVSGAGAAGSVVVDSADEAEAAAQAAYRVRTTELGPALDRSFHEVSLSPDPDEAVRQLHLVASSQPWPAVSEGDAGALTTAVLTAWSSGAYGSLTGEQRVALAGATSVDDFGSGVLAGVLSGTLAGQRGVAVWRFQQSQTATAVQDWAARAARADPSLRPHQVDLKAAVEKASLVGLGATTDAIVAVLKGGVRQETLKDAEHAANNLKSRVVDWRDASLVAVVASTIRFVRRTFSRFSIRLATSTISWSMQRSSGSSLLMLSTNHRLRTWSVGHRWRVGWRSSSSRRGCLTAKLRIDCCSRLSLWLPLTRL